MAGSELGGGAGAGRVFVASFRPGRGRSTCSVRLFWWRTRRGGEGKSEDRIAAISPQPDGLCRMSRPAQLSHVAITIVSVGGESVEEGAHTICLDCRPAIRAVSC